MKLFNFRKSFPGFLIVLAFGTALFSSCKKTETKHPDSETCRLDSILFRLDPSFSYQRSIYEYDAAGRLTRRKDYAGDYPFQINEYSYDGMGRFAFWKLLDEDGVKIAEDSCFFDATGKPAGAIHHFYLPSPPQLDSIYYSFMPDLVTEITRTNSVNQLKIEYEFDEGNIVRRKVFHLGSQTLVDSIQFGPYLTPPLDINESGGFILEQLKNKNLPTHLIRYDVVQQKRIVDEEYTYEFDDKNRLTRRIIKSNLPPHPLMPGNEQEYKYYWHCMQVQN